VILADETIMPKVYRDVQICAMTTVTGFEVMVTPELGITLPTSSSVCEW
jgi:hypothetical protein